MQNKISISELQEFFWEMGEDWHLWDESEQGPYPIDRVHKAMQNFIEMMKSSQVGAKGAYQIIKDYYGDKTTSRSKVPLINHIDEGIEILKSIGADDETIEAYCLHPILQADEAFCQNYSMDFSGVSTGALLLAMEYRRVANSYLSVNKIEDFVGFTNLKIKHMLYADKVQNEKDFALYHEGTHPRSKELREYFDNWLKVLLKDINAGKTKYTISIKELIDRPIIRNDFEEEWMNKMTDEELSQFEKESYQMCLEEGTPEKYPDVNAACLAKHIDRRILYDLLKNNHEHKSA